MRDETVPHKMQILITEAKQANILFNLASSTLSYGCLCISCQDMSSLQTSADSILLWTYHQLVPSLWTFSGSSSWCRKGTKSRQFSKKYVCWKHPYILLLFRDVVHCKHISLFRDLVSHDWLARSCTHVLGWDQYKSGFHHILASYILSLCYWDWKSICCWCFC